MKALVLNGANDFELRNDYPEPVLKKDWVIVKVAYAGICGSDMPRFFETGSYHSPMVLGHEFSGIIAKVNADSNYKQGDPVAVLPIIPCNECENCQTFNQPFHCENYQFLGSRNDGGFGEYVAVPEKNLFPLKSKEMLLNGALIEPALVGLHTVRRSGFSGKGKTIVFGCGPIGLLIAAWLRYFGSEPVLVDVRDYSLNIAKQMGFEKVYRFNELDATSKYDYLYEASGSVAAQLKALEKSNDLSTFTMVGRSPESLILSNDVVERMMRKEVTVKGCWGYNLANDQDILADGFEKINFDKLISHVVSIDDAPKILNDMHAKTIDYCKVILDLGGR